MLQDIFGTSVDALAGEMGRWRNAWLVLTSWEEKGIAEKVLYVLEIPFTVLRWCAAERCIRCLPQLRGVRLLAAADGSRAPRFAALG